MKLNSRNRSLGLVLLLAITAFLCVPIHAQKRRIPTGGRLAVVADERLGVLRATPALTARLVERLSRGRYVAILGSTRSQDGIVFYHVRTSRRRAGWLQSNAVVSASHPHDDQRLLDLIRGGDEFERVARARVFLETFPRSNLRPQVLMLLGAAAEEAAGKLSRAAAGRFEKRELPGAGAPEFSYFLNYSGLDRYNRQGVIFVFDRRTKQFHYNGAAWREIVRRYGTSQ